jgi:hypothetical protein
MSITDTKKRVGRLYNSLTLGDGTTKEEMDDVALCICLANVMGTAAHPAPLRTFG